MYLGTGLEFRQYSGRLSRGTGKECVCKGCTKKTGGNTHLKGFGGGLGGELVLCLRGYLVRWGGGLFQDASDAYKAKWGRALGNCTRQDARTNDFKEDSDLIRLEFQKNQSGSKVDWISESLTMCWKNIV